MNAPNHECSLDFYNYKCLPPFLTMHHTVKGISSQRSNKTTTSKLLFIKKNHNHKDHETSAGVINLPHAGLTTAGASLGTPAPTHIKGKGDFLDFG